MEREASSTYMNPVRSRPGDRQGCAELWFSRQLREEDGGEVWVGIGQTVVLHHCHLGSPHGQQDALIPRVGGAKHHLRPSSEGRSSAHYMITMQLTTLSPVTGCRDRACTSQISESWWRHVEREMEGGGRGGGISRACLINVPACCTSSRISSSEYL